MVSRSSNRAGSRDRWELSIWTDNEDGNDNEKGKEGGNQFHLGKKVHSCCNTPTKNGRMDTNRL